jgi:ubiquitin C-terminal hydrolase
MYNSKFSKYSNNGLTGLANLGNTCYINSCLQILSHCYDFNELMETNKLNNLNNINDSILLKEWKNLRDLMWSKNCTISPNRFINSVQLISRNKNLELFSGFAQNDLPEFLMFLIDCFHNSLKRKVSMKVTGNPENNKDILAKNCFNMIKEMYSENYSELLKLFYGIQVSLIRSEDKYEILSVKPEPFCIINLPIIENTDECSIYECFNNFTCNELLKEDNAWFNEKKNRKENVYKSLCFWSFPDIIIIDLKRFNNYNKKIGTLVNAPLENLNLSDYIVGYDKEVYKYDLFGVCNHLGSCSGGHYTAYVKNANNKWYSFSDTVVAEIDNSKIMTNKAYCLFYKKR